MLQKLLARLGFVAMTTEDCEPINEPAANDDDEAAALSKLALRRLAQDRRAAVRDRDERSRGITGRLLALPEYAKAAAGVVLWYVGARDEVRTLPAIAELLAAGGQIAVPYCEAGELRLVRLMDARELTAGAYGILEPAAALRAWPARQIEPSAIEFAVIPGVAFDRLGTRLGHGAGYYDKLLPKLRPAVPRIGLAFECQLFARLPREEHDVPMTAIVTERGVYPCAAPASSGKAIG